MELLAITDIPRMTGLFEQFGQDHEGLTVVSEIHRGIEELELHKPSVIIIQNHLAGLSADILRKHLKSKLGRRKVRFALISSPSALDVDISSQFEVILDPSLPDEQLLKALQSLFVTHHAARRHDEQKGGAVDQPSLQETAPFLPGLLPQTYEPQAPAAESATPADAAQPCLDGTSDRSDQPVTYEMPRRSTSSIISDFSKQLDTRADDVAVPEPEPFFHREKELGLRDFHREPHLISDFDEPRPWYRRRSVWLVIATLVVVVVVSLLQHRSTVPSATVADKKKPEAKAPAAKATPPAAAAPAAPAAATVSQAPVAQPAPPVQPLTSHGVGRPRALPSFIPREGHDPGYAKEHPGWEHYRGQTVEYRVFREKDTTIKAIQVIDRSGNGVQESFYISMMKELTGATSMRPTSSEIKEGYEIRRGEAGGLQLVQYRDAGGGRMRGFVVTWP